MSIFYYLAFDKDGFPIDIMAREIDNQNPGEKSCILIPNPETNSNDVIDTYLVPSDYIHRIGNKGCTWENYITDKNLFKQHPPLFILENDKAVLKTEKAFLNAQAMATYKPEYIQKVEDRYNQALNLNLSYKGQVFKIHSKSKEGEILYSIIQEAKGSQYDENKAKATQKFFLTQDNTQLECVCYNWVWEYIFIEWIRYLQTTKQLKDNYLLRINSFKKYINLQNYVDHGLYKQNEIDEEDEDDEDYDKGEESKCEFPYPNGLFIDATAIINFIQNNTTDGNIAIPEYIKTAGNLNELIKIAEIETIKGDITNIVKDSWLTTEKPQ